MPSIKKVRKFWIKKGVSPYHSLNTEVIFHDKLDLHLVKFIWIQDKSDLEKAKKILPKSLRRRCKLLPNFFSKKVTTPKESKKFLDPMRKPCRVFASNYRYTGIPIPLYLPKHKNLRYKSSLNYVKDIARNAGMSEDKLKNFHDVPSLEKYMKRKGFYEKEWILHGR